MKILSKKGSTLLELVISIALISIVLVFLMKLLVDLNNTETNNVYAKDNQINRAEIIRTIENDGSTSDNLKIKFTFKNNKTSSINATENKFTYKDTNNNTRSWTMDGGKLYTYKAYLNYSEDAIEDVINRTYTLQINIQVHTTNDKNKFGNNNLLDDILISYIGKYSDFNTNVSCLGYDC